MINFSFLGMGNKESLPVGSDGPRSASKNPHSPEALSCPKLINSAKLRITEQFNKFKDPRDFTIKMDKFQEALSVVDSSGSRRLKNSPLADLIFLLFARANPVSITSDEFHDCASALASTSKDERTETTFQAIAGYGQEYVPFDAIVDLVEKSWQTACKIMISKIRSKAAGGVDHSALIQNFCDKNANNMVDEVRGSLLKTSPKGYLDLSEFAQWAQLDRTVKLIVDGEIVEVPTSLTHQRAFSYLNQT
jgi:Ca2+-binding EF-hand superfamily protein